MGKNAREVVTTKFGISKMIDNFKKVYSEVLA